MKMLNWWPSLPSVCWLDPSCSSVSYRAFSHDVTAAIQWNGGHVGVPNKSCGSWTLFLCKYFLLFRRCRLSSLILTSEARSRGEPSHGPLRTRCRNSLPQPFLGPFQIIRDDWGRVRSVWSTRVKAPHLHAHWTKTRSILQIGAHPPSVNLANKQSIPNKRSALLLPLTFPYVKDFASFVNSIVLVSFQEVSVVWARNLNERALTS